MKLVFLDTEYTGEHACTTLVSLGLVTLDGRECQIALNDYDEDQVTDWLRANVLNRIDPAAAISSAEAYRVVSNWLEAYSQGEPLHVVSAGLGTDLVLLFELWKHSMPGLKYFHALHCLPPYLNHAKHFDLNTLLYIAGGDPDESREAFAGRTDVGNRHEALHDARVVRECFLKLLASPPLRRFLTECGP